MKRKGITDEEAEQIRLADVKRAQALLIEHEARHQARLAASRQKAEQAHQKALRLQEENLCEEAIRVEQARQQALQIEEENRRQEAVRAEQARQEALRIEEQNRREDDLRIEQALQQALGIEGQAFPEEAATVDPTYLHLVNNHQREEAICAEQAQQEALRIEEEERREEALSLDEALQEAFLIEHAYAESLRIQEIVRQEAESSEQAQQEQLRIEQAAAQATYNESLRVQELARQEAIRVEQARQEALRIEQAAYEESVRLQELARQEAAFIEQARQEQLRIEQARQEQLRIEQVAQQAAYEERLRVQELARQEAARQEAARVEDLARQEAESIEQARQERYRNEQAAHKEFIRFQELACQEAARFEELARRESARQEQLRAEQAAYQELICAQESAREEAKLVEQAHQEKLRIEQAAQQAAYEESLRAQELTRQEAARVEELARQEAARVEELARQEFETRKAYEQSVKDWWQARDQEEAARKREIIERERYRLATQTPISSLYTPQKPSHPLLVKCQKLRQNGHPRLQPQTLSSWQTSRYPNLRSVNRPTRASLYIPQTSRQPLFVQHQQLIRTQYSRPQYQTSSPWETLRYPKPTRFRGLTREERLRELFNPRKRTAKEWIDEFSVPEPPQKRAKVVHWDTPLEYCSESVYETISGKVHLLKDIHLYPEDPPKHFYDEFTGLLKEQYRSANEVSSSASYQSEKNSKISTFESSSENNQSPKSRKRSHSQFAEGEQGIEYQSLKSLRTHCGRIVRATTYKAFELGCAAAKTSFNYNIKAAKYVHGRSCQLANRGAKRTYHTSKRTLRKIKLKSQKYVSTTMLRAKRLCCGFRDNLYRGAEFAHQAIFSRENTKVERDDIDVENIGLEPSETNETLQHTDQELLEKNQATTEKEDTDPIQDFEWNDNPDLHKPISLKKTRDGKQNSDSSEDSKEQSQEESDASVKSSSKRVRKGIKDSYDDPITKKFAWLGLNEQEARSLRLQPSTKRLQLRQRDREERERKEREERERLEEEARIRAERLGRIEPPGKKELFRDLSPDLSERVRRAFTSPAHKQLSATVEGTQLLAMHFQTLRPGEWLNDEIINGVLSLYISHAQTHFEDKRQGTPTVQAMGTHFYTRMVDTQDVTVEGIRKSVGRWAARKKIGGKSFLDCSLVLAPVNHGNSHWALLAFWPKETVVEYYDSFQTNPTQVFDVSKKFLQGELKDLYIDSEWSYRVGKSPAQRNGYDCGVFACTTAKMLILGYEPEMSYTGADMAGQRKRIAAELLTVGMEGELQPRFAENWLK